MAGIRQIWVWGIEIWGRFSSRERVFISAGVILTVILLGYQLLISPLMDRIKVLDRLILQKEQEIVDLGQIRRQYRVGQQKVSALENRMARKGQDFSLFTHVEGIAVRNQIKDRILFIRPQPEQMFGAYREVAVEVKVENMTLAQVVSLLNAIENSPQYLRVKRAALKIRYSDPGLLDGTFVVASYEKAS